MNLFLHNAYLYIVVKNIRHLINLFISIQITEHRYIYIYFLTTICNLQHKKNFSNDNLLQPINQLNPGINSVLQLFYKTIEIYHTQHALTSHIICRIYTRMSYAYM